MREYKNEWYAANLHKVTAHNRLHAALRAGKLSKNPCEECGTTHNVCAHHDDYSKPLEVRWLCRVHHGQLHAKLDRMNGKYA